MTENSSTGTKMKSPVKSNETAGRGGAGGESFRAWRRTRDGGKVVMHKKRVKAMQRLDIGALGTSFFPSRIQQCFSVFFGEHECPRSIPQKRTCASRARPISATARSVRLC